VSETSLRAYCARVLGFSNARDVELALGSIRLSVTYRAELVLLGDIAAELVSVARALHRRAVGADRPFIVCNPRRRSKCATVRAPMNYERGVVAFRAARGGSLCLFQERTPDDLPALATLVRDSDAPVQIIVLAEAQYELHPFLLRPAPIRVPPISARSREVPRIIDEYAREATSMLGARESCFTDDDRAWVLARAATTLSEIEKATLRVVALRLSSSVAEAAERLGMSHAALAQWLDRRGWWRRALGRRRAPGERQ